MRALATQVAAVRETCSGCHERYRVSNDVTEQSMLVSTKGRAYWAASQRKIAIGIWITRHKQRGPEQAAAPGLWQKPEQRPR
jgi:hypothetical protein